MGGGPGARARGEPGAQENGEVVVAEGEAGAKAQAFEESSAAETEDREDQSAAQAIEEASVEQSEGGWRQHVKDDDEQRWDSVCIELENSPRNVEEKKKNEDAAGSAGSAVVLDEGRHGGILCFGVGWAPPPGHDGGCAV